MILLFDGGTIPAGWSCISCSGGDDFYQKFIRGNTTYGGTGGSANHTHSASSALSATGSSDTAAKKPGSTIIDAAHTHTFTPTIGSGTNTPSYRQLKVIRYDTSRRTCNLTDWCDWLF